MLGDVAGDGLPTLPRAPPQRALLVDHDPSDVGVDRLALPHPVPGEVELGQRGLEEVLGVGAAAGEQVGGAQQGGLARGEVRREVVVAFVAR